MKFRVTIQPEAEASLVQGALWWAKHRSQKQAIEWWLGFEEAIAGLSDKPDQYPLSRESSKFPYPVRQLVYGLNKSKTHRALFEIHNDEVIVLAIRHLAQDDLAP